MSSAKCDWPVGKSHVPLENDFAVVFFDNIQSKRGLYNKFFKQFEQEDKEKSIFGLQVEVTNSKGPEILDVIILECGLKSICKLTNLHTGTHMFQCDDSMRVLEYLQQIIDCSLDKIGKHKLNTLIVENLSSFYWEKRCQDRSARVQWYKDLNEKLLELKSKYMCNIVVTMWDLEFERGFKSKPSHDTSAPTKTLSYTPNEVMLGSLYAISYRKGDVFQYINGAWLPIRSA